jgi:hypothetical protein
MTARRLARWLLLLLSWVVLVASGAYLLIYLYRWEWNRAVVSGIFFLAAEVALVSASLGRRARRLEDRVERIERSLEEVTPTLADGPPVVVPEPARHEDRAPFPWLEPDGLSVFVPVLLGVGAILSGMAYVVERVATAVEPWRSQRSVEHGLADLQPPSSLLGPVRSARRLDVAAGMPRERRRGSWVGTIAALAVIGLLVWVFVLQLAELTENRPDEVTRGRSTYDLTIQTRGDPAPVLPVAQTLLATCRPMASSWSAFRLEQVGERGVRLVVTPSLPENAERRFTGCLADLQLEGVLVSIEAPGDRSDAA